MESIKLSDFVEQTLLNIVNGIRAAKGHPGARGIDPDITEQPANAKASPLLSPTGKKIEGVEFDVAITTEETEGSKKGIGIVLAPLGVGAKQESQTKSSSVSRIKFNVPISYT